MSPTDDILTLEESVHYVRSNYLELYPKAKVNGKTARGKSIADIPVSLHLKIQAIAQKHKLQMCEVVAGLWDFYEQYELINAAELKRQRIQNKNRR